MKKYAFLAGVEQYSSKEVNTLHYAVNDVEEIGRVLEEHCGFEPPTVLANPTDQVFMEELEQMVPEIGDDDLFLFLFTGHGMERGEESCLMTHNASPKKNLGLIRLGELQKYFASIRAARRMILLDCCRNDPESSKAAADNLMGSVFSRNVDFSFGSSNDNQVTMILKACKTGQRAYEWARKKHGVFSWYLREGMLGEAWQGTELSARNLCAFVQDEVAKWGGSTGHIQQPDFVQTEGAADIILASREPDAPAKETASEMVCCPECGKYNHIVDTFRCLSCSMDHLCMEHRTGESGLCPSCGAPASEPTVEETPAAPSTKLDRPDDSKLPLILGGLLAGGAAIGFVLSQNHQNQPVSQTTSSTPRQSVVQTPVKSAAPAAKPTLAELTAQLGSSSCTSRLSARLAGFSSKIAGGELQAGKDAMKKYLDRYRSLCSPQAMPLSGTLFDGAQWYLPEQQNGGLLVTDNGKATSGKTFVQSLLPRFARKDKALCTAKPQQLFGLLSTMDRQGGLSFTSDFWEKGSGWYNAACGDSVAWYAGLDVAYNGSSENLFYYPHTASDGQFINSAGKKVATGSSVKKGLAAAITSGNICHSNENSLLKLFRFMEQSGTVKLADDFYAKLSANYAARCGVR